MSSIDAEAAASRIARIDPSTDRIFVPPRRRQRARIGSVIGGFLLTGVFLALTAAAFALSAVYGFIWFAQH